MIGGGVKWGRRFRWWGVFGSPYLGSPPWEQPAPAVANSSQVQSYSSGEHEGSVQRKPPGPARWGRVVDMHSTTHAASPAALWAAWDDCTCAGAALNDRRAVC
jgi:hypothetical protein